MANGEEVVIARLTIDSEGVIRGVVQAQSALGRGAKTTDEFGRASMRSADFTGALVTRMFSLRNIASAFLGGATLAGLVFWLKNLAAAAFEASAAGRQLTETLKTFNENMVDWISSTLFGADATDKLQTNLARLGKAAGVGSLSMSTQITALGDLQRALEQAIPQSGRMSAEQLVFRAALEETNKRIRDTFEALRKFTTLSPSAFRRIFEAAFGAKVTAAPPIPQDLFAVAGILSPEKQAELLRNVKLSRSEIESSFRAGALSAEQYTTALINLGAALKAAGIEQEKINAAVGQVPERIEAGLNAYQQQLESLEHLAQGFKSAEVRAFLFRFALEGIADALTLLALGQARSIKQFFADMLAALARTAFQWGVFALALAIITRNSRYAVAAAKFFAVGVGAALLSRTLREEDGGAASGRAQAALAPEPGVITPIRTQSVTVIIEGSVLGTNKDELIRDIQRGLRLATADNA